MSALSRVARSGVTRRRLQTLVLAVTTMTAVAAGVLAAGLLVASKAPFDQGFARQLGAHLAVELDAGTVTPTMAAATAQVSPVSAAAGPYPMVTTTVKAPATESYPDGFDLPPISVVGRDSPGGSVDTLDLVSGRWPVRSGEIVLATGAALPTELPGVRFPGAPGAPTLTVVGVATSMTSTADAWALPDQVRGLAGTGAGKLQMLYRLADADTDGDVAAGLAAIAAALPVGSLTGSSSWLAVKQVQGANIEVFVPFVVAFAVLGLVLSVLIIVTVVSGAVGAARQRIGILKAVGFTPWQVTRAFGAQALMPAGVGVLIGVLLGDLAALPVLRAADISYQTSGLSIPVWVNVVVPMAALGVVAIAAVRPGDASRTAEDGAGDHPRPDAVGRARPSGTAVGRPASRAPLGELGPGPTVRPAEPIEHDRSLRGVRGDRHHPGRRPGHLVEQRAGEPKTRCRRTGLGQHGWPAAVGHRCDPCPRPGQPTRDAGRRRRGCRRHRRPARDGDLVRHQA